MRILGLKVRSGFAIGVILGGGLDSWKIERRIEVPLTAGDDHYARFPFHPLVDLEGPAGVATCERYVALVQGAAQKSLPALLEALQPLDGAAIVAGSLVAPEKITNPHMRVHAREGELFRRVLGEALVAKGMAPECVSEKGLWALCAARLGIEEAKLKAVVERAPRGPVKPWRSDEKLAACGALWRLAAP